MTRTRTRTRTQTQHPDTQVRVRKTVSPSFFLLSTRRVSFVRYLELVMKAAVKSGDVKELAELMRQDPGLDVNMGHGSVWTLLHHACDKDSRSAVIPLLLAHPDIEVNAKSKNGQTPFDLACYGHPSCVREMLKDSRVKVNKPQNDGRTPLWYAAAWVTLTSSSGGLCLKGRWISGNQGMSAGRIPLG